MKNHAPHHKDIADILGSVRDRDHYTVIRDFFELSAISIRNNFDHGNEYANLEKRYKEIAQGYKKEYLEGFATALGMLGKKIQDAVNGNAPFADWAGELYMDSGTSNGKAGQFFTPYSVSQCMARINFPKDEVRAKLGSDPNRVLTIYEPTCGAGGLIVASIDALNEAGVNYSWNGRGLISRNKSGAGTTRTARPCREVGDPPENAPEPPQSRNYGSPFRRLPKPYLPWTLTGNIAFSRRIPMGLGLPYNGSKNTIAEDIVKCLPRGGKLLDACCGGGAVLMAAAMSNRWEKVVGNDLNPATIALLDAVLIHKGQIEYEHPPVCTRRDFFNSLQRIANGDFTIQDCVNKYCASFRNNGQTYLWNEDIEKVKTNVEDMLCNHNAK